MYIECGRFDRQTQPAMSLVEMKTHWYERLTIPVRQKDNEITFSLYKTGAIHAELLGQLTLNVITDLIEPDFPQNKWYQFKLDNRNTCNVLLSFRKLDADMPEYSSPLLQQAMIMAQFDAQERGEKLNIDYAAMNEQDKLVFLARVLEGPLNQMRTVGGWQELYFSAVETRPGHWEWCFWNSKHDCYAGKPSKGSLKFMGISLVLSDKKDRHQFYVKYNDTTGVHHLFFKRVDRDRDIWSDGLYEFIERLRDAINKVPQNKMQTQINRLQAKQKKKKKDGPEGAAPKERVVALNDMQNERRLVNPLKQSTEKREPKPKDVSNLFEKILDNNYEYVSEDEDEEEDGDVQESADKNESEDKKESTGQLLDSLINS